MIALLSEVRELQPSGLQLLVPFSSCPTVLKRIYPFFVRCHWAGSTSIAFFLTSPHHFLVCFTSLSYNTTIVMCFVSFSFLLDIKYNCDSTPYILNLLSFAWVTVFHISLVRFVSVLSYLHIPKTTSRNGFLSCDAFSTIYSLSCFIPSLCFCHYPSLWLCSP